MSNGLHGPYHQLNRRLAAILAVATIVLLVPYNANSQTSSTGALSGLALDPTGALLPDVVVRLANKETATTRSATSDKDGRFSFLLLPPGEYEIQATRPGSVSLVGNATVYINVTETLRLELHLRLATVVHSISVSEESKMVQTDNYSLGRVANETAVIGFPLVTRNFAQIASLSPGVITGVYNAGELGLGGTALSQIASSNDGLYVHGSPSYAK